MACSASRSAARRLIYFCLTLSGRAQERPLRAAGAHDQADRDTGDHALRLGAPGRGAVNRPAVHAGGFISAVSQPNRFAKVRNLWGGEL